MVKLLSNSITNNPLIVIHSSLPSHPNILIRNLTLNLIGGDREECGDRKYFKYNLLTPWLSPTVNKLSGSWSGAVSPEY